VDACLRVSMITAPAIYAEAASRLLIAPIGGNSPPPFANQPTMTGWAKSPAITIPAKNFVTPATKPAGTVIVSKGGKLRAVEPQPGDRLIELDDEE
jgi:hypothetical protein